MNYNSLKFIILIACSHAYTSIHAQTPALGIVHTGGEPIDVREGATLRKGSWGVDPSVRPDVFDLYIEGKSKNITFITARDSISFNVEPGKSYPFVFLLNGKDSAFTEVRGIKVLPRAKFSNAYQQTHRGKTFVEIPQVYELLNIVFALTDKGKAQNGLIARDTPYYQDVMAWFAPFSKDPAVQKINAELNSGPEAYHALKMDAYAFEQAANGTIIQSPVYDRIGRSYANNIRAYIPDLQAFSKTSNFEQFYKKHQPYYQKLIATYRDSIGVPEMQKWLTRNFPSTKYDSFKIILSPLVSNNQSASSFEDNGFREAQAHVNFPFHKEEDFSKWSKQALFVKDGNIVFTELNHSFIGPEGEKPQYRARIQKAFSNLTIWNDPDKPARGYNTPQQAFDEYMNWALISLRYIDYAPAAEQDKLIAQIEDMMVDIRGFRKFPAFNQFLVKAYKGRKKGQVVADLYPGIVEWFEVNSNQSNQK